MKKATLVPNEMTRRRFLAGSAAAVAWSAMGPVSAADKKSPGAVSLGIGNYGMKTLKTEEALRTIAGIGYDGVELALMPGWPTEAKLLSATDRKELRARLGDLKLALPSLLESLPMKGTPEARALNLDRLKKAAELAHDLAPGNPPVIETILGLKTSEWETAKGRMAEELRDWATVAESTKVTVCFKPHAANAVHSPERALWLLKEVGSTHIRLIYDYSHMFVEGFPLEESLKQILPHTSFIHVKDAAGTPTKHEFLLPGDGQTDYVKYFGLLKQLGYSGPIIIEISGMIHGKPGYQPVPTAKLCYERMAGAIEKAGLRREKHG